MLKPRLILSDLKSLYLFLILLHQNKYFLESAKIAQNRSKCIFCFSVQFYFTHTHTHTHTHTKTQQFMRKL
jgi:hypothetical protein